MKTQDNIKKENWLVSFMKCDIKLLHKILINRIKWCIKRIYVPWLSGISRYTSLVQYPEIDQYHPPYQWNKEEKSDNHITDAEKTLDKIKFTIKFS